MIPELPDRQHRTDLAYVSTIFCVCTKFGGSLIVKEDGRRCLEFLNLMAAMPFLLKICNAIAINGESKPTKGDAPSRVASNWCDGSRENSFTAIEIKLRTERKACARQRSHSINSRLCLRFTGQ